MMRALLAIHVVAGSVALLSMVVPLVTRKGGTSHRRWGWVFVAGMAIVSATALLLSGARFLTDPTPQGRRAGAFLFFIAILTGAGVSAGMRVLRAKKRTTPHRGAWDLGLAGLLTVTSAAAAAYGLTSGDHLFTAFSAIGLLNGAGQLASWRRVPTHPMHWWFEHMNAMMGACIAATTAFLVNNAGRLGFDTFSFLVWLGPSAIGVPVIAIWNAYYRRKFAGIAGRVDPNWRTRGRNGATVGLASAGTSNTAES